MSGQLVLSFGVALLIGLLYAALRLVSRVTASLIRLVLATVAVTSGVAVVLIFGYSVDLGLGAGPRALAGPGVARLPADHAIKAPDPSAVPPVLGR